MYLNCYLKIFRNKKGISSFLMIDNLYKIQKLFNNEICLV